jgi:hypothetical protein
MSALSIQPTFPIFTDIDGQPLDSGYVFIGTANLNPIGNPINVFFDAALTQPAVQPIRTISGYPSNAGTPARLYVNSDYSIQVQNKNGTLVYSAPEATEIYSSDLITFVQSGAGAVERTIQARERDTVHVTDFIPPGTNTSTTPCQSYFQAAIDSLPPGGGVVYVPKGVYLITATIRTKNLVIIQGEGDNSQFLVNTDIETFDSNPATTIFQAEFRKIFIRKTVTGLTTKYDIHLYNPNICHIEQCHVQSGHNDNQYSNVNVGGIWLDNTGVSSCFMNRLENNWIQNNSIYFKGVTDSTIIGGFVWGHTRSFAIKLEGGGNINIESIEGILCSQFNGGIWIDGAGFNMARIHSNLFDGGVASVVNGTAINVPQLSFMVSVVNNIIWECDKHGIVAVDPVGWTITGNCFYKGNRLDANQDDIRIVGKTFQPNRNVVSSNAFFNDVAKTNRGFAINEVNDGFTPTGNIYSNNGIQGPTAYLTPSIRLLGSAQAQSNSASPTPGAARDFGNTLFGDTSNLASAWAGIQRATNQLIDAAGTMDLAINETIFLGNPGGFVGQLYVTSTRFNAPTQSRRQIFNVFCHGTTATITSIALQDGSGGGSTFTITVPTDGVIRFTDTSGQQVAASMMFVGTRSLA